MKQMLEPQLEHCRRIVCICVRVRVYVRACARTASDSDWWPGSGKQTSCPQRMKDSIQSICMWSLP